MTLFVNVPLLNSPPSNVNEVNVEFLDNSLAKFLSDAGFEKLVRYREKDASGAWS